MDKHPDPKHGRGPMERFAGAATTASGSSVAFILALGTILVWGAVGPLAHFSDTWQLIINTGTTIVTFLMVFLIQRAQNKESMAMQLKLNELIAAMHGASNHLINVENRNEEELIILHQHYAKLSELIARDGSLAEAHSVTEAEERAQEKARST